MYGSIFIDVTLRSRAFRRVAMEEDAMPFPTPDITPPTTKMYLCPELARAIVSLYHELSSSPNFGLQQFMGIDPVCI